jgi:hypothetical protein
MDRTEYQAQYYRNHQETKKVSSREYYATHKEQFKVYARSPGRKVVRRKYELMKRYSLTVEQFDEMLKKQDGHCAICPTTKPGGKGAWHVDHDHETGQVRGILCFNCNGGLGQFRDSIDALLAAAAYLDARDSETVELADLTRARAGELREVPV